MEGNKLKAHSLRGLIRKTKVLHQHTKFDQNKPMNYVTIFLIQNIVKSDLVPAL